MGAEQVFPEQAYATVLLSCRIMAAVKGAIRCSNDSSDADRTHGTGWSIEGSDSRNQLNSILFTRVPYDNNLC